MSIAAVSEGMHDFLEAFGADGREVLTNPAQTRVTGNHIAGEGSSVPVLIGSPHGIM